MTNRILNAKGFPSDGTALPSLIAWSNLLFFLILFASDESVEISAPKNLDVGEEEREAGVVVRREKSRERPRIRLTNTVTRSVALGCDQDQWGRSESELPDFVLPHRDRMGIHGQVRDRLFVEGCREGEGPRIFSLVQMGERKCAGEYSRGVYGRNTRLLFRDFRFFLFFFRFLFFRSG